MYNFQLQANGLDERFNQTLQSMLVKFVAEKQKHWDDFLDTCTFAYNTSVHESALFSPFDIMFGRKATLPIDLVMAKQDSEGKLQKCLETGGELSVSEVEKLASHRQGIIEEAKQNIKQAQEKQEVYDLKHAHPDAFKVGCQVLKKDFRRKKQANGKLNMRYLGPYEITEKLGKGLYALELVADPTQVVSRVHGAHLKPYHLPPSTDHSDTTTDASSASDVSLEQPSTEPSVPSVVYTPKCEDSIPPLPSPLRTPCNTTFSVNPTPSESVDQPILTSSPVPGKSRKPHSSINLAARDLMVKVRQSKAKQESNPEVICIDSYKPKKISSKAVQSKKKQPWIDSGIVKLSTAVKAVIKSPTGWLTDEIIDAAQNTLHEQFGVPGFQSVLRGQSCSFNVESE